ncbi:hypothetical protein SAMN05421866_4196 [Chryseobacterium oranimense]|uniref:Uncharacterized protein n=1 Tax=Chryseobacterium oranimense TaxID=421058 RepID=A0A1M5WSC3_9FLAO|nr:hypothetical protein [Chryseobacterium oranimense]SHH90014.1 hypothetical protein SAMN05421866_4196 [Chryseobacterium oranimense]
MNEFKGTKYHWVVDTEVKSTEESIFFLDIDSPGCLQLGIATIYGGSENDIEMKANAQLIAKAPQMLEMLKKARDKFMDLKHDNDLPELKDIQWQIEDLIKEATEL